MSVVPGIMGLSALLYTLLFDMEVIEIDTPY